MNYKPSNSARSPTAKVPHRIIKAIITFILKEIDILNFSLKKELPGGK
jgi:hypothetical protein